MTPKLLQSVLGSTRFGEGMFGTSDSEMGIAPSDVRMDGADEWLVVEVGREPNVYEPDSDGEQGVRVVPPHLDAAILVHPILVGRVFKERMWRVALQEKRKFWETGEQYVYETRWEEWVDSRRELDSMLEALRADLAAATQLSDLRVIEDSTDAI